MIYVYGLVLAQQNKLLIICPVNSIAGRGKGRKLLKQSVFDIDSYWSSADTASLQWEPRYYLFGVVRSQT